jgi:precorrin-2 dehydrogenase/sirohydrochlorin ferrochelatase
VAGYTIELDLRGRTALVVGLGLVGRRKASGLLAAGARVIGVDPEAREADVPAGTEIRAESYGAEHLRGVSLAIASATAEVNRRVVADARCAGIWVCSASDSAEGDFTVPALWRDGLLTLSVSTSGASPALAAALRDRAAEALGPAASGLVSLLAELRRDIVARLPDDEARRRVLADWADPRWLTLWQSEGPDAVRRAIEDEVNRASF